MDVVVKVMQVGTMSKRMKQEARNEVNLLSRLDHPNVVKYYECAVEGEQMYIVMEYCDGGDLTKFLKSRRGAPSGGGGRGGRRGLLLLSPSSPSAMAPTAPAFAPSSSPGGTRRSARRRS